MALATILNSLLNVLSAVVAFLVSYYAHRANRLVRSDFLNYIAVGFLLLGAGLLIAGATQTAIGLTPVGVAKLRGFQFVEFLVYIFLEFFAFMIFALGYARSAFGVSGSPTATTTAPAGPLTAAAVLVTQRELVRFVYVYGTFLFVQLGIIVLLLFVLVQGIIVYTKQRSTITATVLFAFILIFVAHVMLFSAVVVASDSIFLLGNFIQFLGFLSLLFFLFRSGVVGPG